MHVVQVCNAAVLDLLLDRLQVHWPFDDVVVSRCITLQDTPSVSTKSRTQVRSLSLAYLLDGLGKYRPILVSRREVEELSENRLGSLVIRRKSSVRPPSAWNRLYRLAGTSAKLCWPMQMG